MKKSELFLLFLVWITASVFVLDYFKVSVVLDPLVLVYALAIFFLTRALWAWNWASLNKAVGLGHRYTTLFKGTLICAFTDSVTPPLMPSAELAMAYYLSKKFGKSMSSYLPVIFMQSTFMITAQIVIFVGGGLLLGGIFFRALAYLIALFVFLFVAAAFVLNFKRDVIKWFISLSFKRVEGLEKAVGKMLSLFSKRRLLTARIFSVEVVNVLVEASVVYFLIGGEAEMLVVAVAFASSHLLSFFSMLPGGLGVFETSLTAILALSGIPIGVVLPAVLVYRSLFFWLNIFLGSYVAGSEVYEWLGKAHVLKKIYPPNRKPRL